MSAPLLDYEDALRWVLECTSHTRGKLEARPVVAYLAADFLKFQDAWMAVNTKEILLWVDIVRAAARVVACDDDLDDLVELVDSTLYLEGKEFRTVGERKALVDTANALFKGTYGTLSRMPHDKPELKLPRNFAEPFFKRAPSKSAKGEEEPETAAKLVQMIQDGEATIAELRDRLEAAVAREAAEEATRTAREANLAELARLQKEADERNAQIAALRTELGMK